MTSRSRTIVVEIRGRADTSAFKKVRTEVRHLATLSQTAARSIKTAFTGVFAGLAGIAGFGTAFGTGAFFKGAVKSAADFEKAMSRVEAKAGATEQELAAIRQAAERLGATTKFTATEAAQGFEVLAQAGVNARDSLKVLPAVLDTALAADVNLAQATTLVVDALTQFQRPASEAARVADVLAKGSLLANTSIRQLGFGLSYVGAQANAAGLSVEQTVALLDALATGGLRGERAGTGLRNILAQLSDPASKFRDALRSVGIESAHAIEIFDQLSRQSASEVQTALQGLDLEARTAGQVLVDNAGKIDRFNQALLNAAGVSKEVARIAGNNLSGALKGLASAWDAVQRTIVNQDFLNVIRREVETVTGAFRQAVSDGSLNNFREALISAFQSTAQGVRNFVKNFNFTEALQTLQNFASIAPQFFGAIATAGVKAAAVLTLAWEGLITVLNLASVAYHKIAETLANNEIANLTQRIEFLQQALAKAPDDSKAGAVRAEIAQLQQQLDAAKEKANQFGIATVDAMEAALQRTKQAQQAVDTLFNRKSDSNAIVEAGKQQAQAADEAATAANKLKDSTKQLGQSAARDLEQWRKLLADGVISQTTFDQYAQGAKKAQTATRGLTQSIKNETTGTEKAFTNVKAALDEIDSKTALPKIKVNDSPADKNLDRLEARLKKLERGITIPIQTSGSVPTSGFAYGGPVPGTGNRDTVQAMLTPGEFVITKSGNNILQALRYYAQRKPGILQNIQLALSNKTLLAQSFPTPRPLPLNALPLFNQGGPVPPVSRPRRQRDELTLTFRAPNGQAAQTTSSRQDAQTIVDLFGQYLDVSAAS